MNDPLLLFTELGYPSQPIIPFTTFSARLAQVLPDAKIVSDPADPSLLLIHHTTHLNSTGVPAQTAILRAQHNDTASFNRALDQTWTWPEARAIAPKIAHQLGVCEFLAQGVPYKTRALLFHTVLEVLVETLPPLAVFAEYAQVIIDPATLPKPAIKTTEKTPFLNVRLFQIEGMRPGDTLMDTRGLAAFGLPDFQIKFSGLPVQQVANLIINYAHYLYTHGPVIQSGHIIQGITPKQQWTCTLQNALVEPKRPVLDLDPGSPYALEKPTPGATP
jgi:hypothetical protein